MDNRLFQAFQLGGIILSNRCVMAPLTRRRAENPGLVPNDLMAEYYRQRSSAGLIISEGSPVSPRAYGYTHTPGCYTDGQLEGWKKITGAVHDAGGKIFMQLWHVGPFSHKMLQTDGQPPLSASNITPVGEVLTSIGRIEYGEAKAMTHDEIRETVADFGRAARNALGAGFDGVEVHGAHAYLIDQFIMDGTNKRNDQYGGSIENRSRFLFEVLDEIVAHIPASRVGLRLSPKRVRPGMSDSNPELTYGYIIERLNDYQLAYLHISEMIKPEIRASLPEKTFVPHARELYSGTLISCGGHTLESATRMLDAGHADLIAFGKPFISNPDLVHRLKTGAPLTDPDEDTFYHGGEKGYTDYPFSQL